MAVNWGEELGLNMDDLIREHPGHPDQLRMKRVISRNAEAYWARERFLARLEDNSAAVVPETQPEPKEKPVRKRGRVGRYEFTDAQLEIARRSLNAQDSV
jgi:hypothetical protein